MLRIDQSESSDPHAPDFVDAPSDEPADAPSSESSLLKTIRHLWPYIWPRGRRDLERRVAARFRAACRQQTLQYGRSPYAFKWATDALAEGGAGAVAAVGVGAVGFTLLDGRAPHRRALF